MPLATTCTLGAGSWGSRANRIPARGDGGGRPGGAWRYHDDGSGIVRRHRRGRGMYLPFDYFGVVGGGDRAGFGRKEGVIIAVM